MTKRCSRKNVIGRCIIGLWLTGMALSGCSPKAADTPGETRMVYVDTQTDQAVVMEATDELPAVNPASGKRTMMPGLYCTQCEQWHAVPPPEQINRVPGAAVCLKTKTPLTADGPWPEDEARSR